MAELPGGGLSVVAVGGGRGLSTSLRAVRRYAREVTAIVSVADDGGSTGRLRQRLPDLPAPGDVRKCLGALADDESAVSRVLEYRLDEGEMEGHALGNLLLVALTHELGSFEAAIKELGRRLGAVGTVLPATVHPVMLEGRGPSGLVVGQVAVQNTPGIVEVSLQPADPSSPPAALKAIAACDQVVLGPGSLFTSVLAAAMAPQVRAAISSTHARRIYVANLAPEVPETGGFSVTDELATLERHGVAVEVVVVDRGRADGVAGVPVEVVVADVADETATGHDPVRLAAVLGALGGPQMGQVDSDARGAQGTGMPEHRAEPPEGLHHT